MRRNAVKTLFIVMIAFFMFGLGAVAFGDAASDVKEYSGTVSFRYGGGFFLNTDADEEYRLVLGPPWYLDNLGLKLKNGDRVTIQGVEDDGAIFVGTLRKGSKTFNIADLSDIDDYFCHGMYGMMQERGRGPGMMPGGWYNQPYTRGWRR